MDLRGQWKQSVCGLKQAGMKEALLRREGMGVELKRGDCLEVMDGLEDNSVDLVLTDPPYSSGGLFAGDRKSRTSSK